MADEKKVLYSRVHINVVVNGFVVLMGRESAGFDAETLVARTPFELCKVVDEWAQTHHPQPAEAQERAVARTVTRSIERGATLGPAREAFRGVISGPPLPSEEARTTSPLPPAARHAADICPPGTFGWAIATLKIGGCVRRRNWNGKGMWLALERFGRLDGGAKTEPFIYMSTADGKFVPWLASQTDMLAEDWERVC